MNTWTIAQLGRRLAALTITTGLTLGVAGCSVAGREHDRAVTVGAGSDSSTLRAQQGRAGAPLAELHGQSGLALTITSAERDPAGYLTVRGNLKNDAFVTTVVPAQLRGGELEVLRTGPSLAGATLVDFAHKKRYYVLRDTSGHPLTTTGLSTLKAGESARVFMQFPSPSSSTVGFQLPLFDTATITITG
ncbi:hypothetical protein [Streptomyces sp. CoT10]|uniref:hypothetical protein n=1 Tax=Streptomyces sp. CoT10 TaxID=2875762 RepID=UPI001CD7FFD7|nr:hypothetical protein [Streptomyces sp. CoT10]